MTGWYEARTSSLSYAVAMSRREKVIQMSDASLRSQWQESGRKTTPASQPQAPEGQCSCLLLPGGRKRAAVGMKVSLCSLTPTPLQVCTKRERAEGTLGGLRASLPGEVSSKLRTLAAASCAACQNLLWGLSQTYFVEQ